MNSNSVSHKNEPCIKVADIKNKLRKVGLQNGDVVLVHSSLGKMRPIEGIPCEDRQGYVAAIYEAFADVLDIPKSGTLVVPTFTHKYDRNGVPFVYEESPSEVGLFSEYVRKLPDALRSIHPINSLVAIGKKRKICEGVGINCMVIILSSTDFTNIKQKCFSSVAA